MLGRRPCWPGLPAPDLSTLVLARGCSCDTCDDDDGRTTPVVELIEPDPDDFQLFSIDLRMLGLAAEGGGGGTAGAEVVGGIMRNGADMCGLGRLERSSGGGGRGAVAGYGGAAGVSGRGGNEGARRTGYGDS